jgi:hypothetical protein
VVEEEVVPEQMHLVHMEEEEGDWVIKITFQLLPEMVMLLL